MINRSDFIKCDDYKKLPIGTYLVLIDEEEGRNPYHVATVHENITVVGDHFYFDRKPLLGYVDITHLKSDKG